MASQRASLKYLFYKSFAEKVFKFENTANVA